MQSFNHKSFAIEFIAKAIEFKWLPLPLLKLLPLRPSIHNLMIAAHILELASTDNLDCTFEDCNPKFKKILLENKDFYANRCLLKNKGFIIDGYLLVSERTVQHIWNEWKYLMFAPNSKARKRGMETIISSPVEMLAIKRLLSEAYGINWGPMLKTII